ncbi:MAG TPA: hypothetical protein VMM85_06110, partial [Methylomirabilota bacterium]|nr:hypothetical protein [Methylomirabilota bacterium]
MPFKEPRDSQDRPPRLELAAEDVVGLKLDPDSLGLRQQVQGSRPQVVLKLPTIAWPAIRVRGVAVASVRIDRP